MGPSSVRLCLHVDQFDEYWEVKEGDTVETFQLIIAYKYFTNKTSDFAQAYLAVVGQSSLGRENTPARLPVPTLGYVVPNTETGEEEWKDLDLEKPISSLQGKDIRCKDRADLGTDVTLAFYRKLLFTWEKIASRLDIQRGIKVQEQLSSIGIDWARKHTGDQPSANRREEFGQWYERRRELFTACMPIICNSPQRLLHICEGLSCITDPTRDTFVECYFSSLCNVNNLDRVIKAIKYVCENLIVSAGYNSNSEIVRDMLRVVSPYLISENRYKDCCEAVNKIHYDCDEALKRVEHLIFNELRSSAFEKTPELVLLWLEALDKQKWSKIRSTIFDLYNSAFYRKCPSLYLALRYHELQSVPFMREGGQILSEEEQKKKRELVYLTIFGLLEDLSREKLLKVFPQWLKEEERKNEFLGVFEDRNSERRNQLEEIYNLVEGRSSSTSIQDPTRTSTSTSKSTPNPTPTSISTSKSNSLSIFNSVVFKVASLFIFISLCIFSVSFGRGEKQSVK